MRAALGLCAFLIVGLATAGDAAAQPGPSAPVPEWFVRGVVAALQDAGPGVPGAALKLPRAAEAVFATAKASPEPVRKKLLTEVQALLNSQDPSVRRAAAATLEAIAVLETDPSTLVAALRERLKKDHDEIVLKVTAAASGVLTVSDSDRTSFVAALRERLEKDQDFNIRKAAAAALAVFPVPVADRGAVIAGLRERLEKDPNSFVQIAAAAALAAFTVPGPDRTAIVTALRKRLDKDQDPDFWSAAATALAAFAVPEADRTSIVTTLRERLEEDPNAFGRYAAAFALGAFAVPEPDRPTIVAALRDRLEKDQERSVRGAAAAALGKFPVPEADRSAVIAALRERLQADQDPNVRSTAAAALAKFPVPETDRASVVAALREQLEKEPVPFVRSAAISALGTFAVPQPDRTSVADALRERLEKDQDPNVRNAAAAALVNFGPVGRDTVLAEWRAMHDGEVRQSAAWLAYGIASAGAPAWPDPVHVMLTFLGRPAPNGVAWREVDGAPRQAVAYLKVLDASWPDIVPSEGLRVEAADRVIDIVQHACRGSLDTNWSVNPVRQAWSRLREELVSAWRWLSQRDDEEKPRRCWTASERDVLSGLRSKLAQGGLISQANELQRAIDADAALPWIGLIGYGAAGWALFWLGLIGAFPYSRKVRAVYLFNDKLRGMLSLWFVPLLLTLIPGARRHLLRPFRADLLRDARMEDFDDRLWFSDTEATDRGGARVRLADALPGIAGVCLLVGESGLGKTLFLRRMAKRSRRPLAFLHARGCAEGVPEAIAQATKGVQDSRFFESMIFTGSLAVIIDGLNEVSAEARGKILEFFKRNARDGNILVSTQPLEWGDKDGPPVPGARILELLPLNRVRMESFLLSRPVGSDPKRRVNGPEYSAAVKEFLRTTLDDAPSEEERASAQLVLSNPMDLTYASELISVGLMPRPSEMVGQGFELARKHYLDVEKRQFPTALFAKHVVELRMADRNWLDPGDFANEQPALEDYRLLVRTVIRNQEGQEESRPRFRHDKVVDFFLKLAFDDDPTLQVAHFDDPRFRGVYLLYAQTAAMDIARRLRDQLVLRAAATRDHALSDEFVRRLSLRDTDTVVKEPDSTLATAG
jgi:HEAT repeat protein